MNDKKVILVVDDELDLVKVLKFRLENLGYDVRAAFDGQEALSFLKKTTPDLIILDVNMPVMGGVAFYKEILNEEGTPQYPVLVLTARGELEDLFEEIHADAFMPKPFEIQDLIKKVRELTHMR